MTDAFENEVLGLRATNAQLTASVYRLEEECDLLAVEADRLRTENAQQAAEIKRLTAIVDGLADAARGARLSSCQPPVPPRSPRGLQQGEGEGQGDGSEAKAEAEWSSAFQEQRGVIDGTGTGSAPPSAIVRAAMDAEEDRLMCAGDPREAALAPLARLPTWHGGLNVIAAVLDPLCPGVLASGGVNKTVRLAEWATGRLLGQVELPAPVLGLCFSATCERKGSGGALSARASAAARLTSQGCGGEPCSDGAMVCSTELLATCMDGSHHLLRCVQHRSLGAAEGAALRTARPPEEGDDLLLPVLAVTVMQPSPEHENDDSEEEEGSAVDPRPRRQRSSLVRAPSSRHDVGVHVTVTSRPLGIVLQRVVEDKDTGKTNAKGPREDGAIDEEDQGEDDSVEEAAVVEGVVDIAVLATPSLRFPQLAVGSRLRAINGTDIVGLGSSGDGVAGKGSSQGWSYERVIEALTEAEVRAIRLPHAGRRLLRALLHAGRQ